MSFKPFAGSPPILYLDTNAWIKLATSSLLLESLSKGHLARNFQVLVSEQNVFELFASEVSETNQTQNLQTLKAFMSERAHDAVFVIGHSLLGQASLGTKALNTSIDMYLRGKKPSTNNLSDAIHLVNAQKAKATLVSCDIRLRNGAVKQGIPVVCLSMLAIYIEAEFRNPCSRCGQR